MADKMCLWAFCQQKSALDACLFLSVPSVFTFKEFPQGGASLRCLTNALLQKNPNRCYNEVSIGECCLCNRGGESDAHVRVMLDTKADSLFEQRFCQKTEKRFISYFNQAYSERMSEPDAPPLDLKDHIIAAAGRGAIVWWLNQEQSCSPEQLAHWLNQFTYDISVSSLKLKG
jgi:hypothetical protein